MKPLPKYAAYAIVAVGALIMLAPFYFMFVFATQSRTDIFNVPPPLWFSGELLNNIAVLTGRLPFWKNVGWSLYVGLMSTALTLLFCSMAGYAFAMLEFRFKRALFALVMATMMVPAFIGNAAIDSFQATFKCDNCHREVMQLIEMSGKQAAGEQLGTCGKCGGKLLPGVDLESDLEFVTNR